MPICDLVLRFFGTYSGTLCRSGPCILRYLWCYARPIWSLYSSIFMVIHWADLVPVFFDTYRNILYRSDISGQDAQSDATFLWRPPLHPHHKTSPPPTASLTDQFHLPLASLYTSNKIKSPGAQQIQHCQTPEQKEQMSSGYSQSTSLLAHNRITAPQLIAFRSPAKDLIDPVKPQSLPIHCIRLTSRNISFIIQRTIITSQMPLHNIRIPHN